MASLDIGFAAEAVESLDELAQGIPYWVAALGGIPLLLVVYDAIIPSGTGGGFGGLSEGEAMTMYGVMGGVGGFLSQVLVAQNFKKFDGSIHILELIPSVVASVFLSAYASWRLTPPRFQTITKALRKAGYLPR